MKGVPLLVLVAAASLADTAGVGAEMPVAIVEEVNGKPVGIEFMDYVAAGRVIKLGPRDTIVLSYLKSCWRERITGGTVVVGAEQSEVQRGQVDRTRVRCDGGYMQLSGKEALQGAGVVSRAVDLSNRNAMLPDPRITIYGQVPIIEVTGRGTLLVERLDQAEERYRVVIGKPQLLRGMFFDFAKADWTLAPGGLYRATFGESEVIFRVDPAATAVAPVVGRLIRF
jgi:hypothetical protein